jgi:MoaA/NifB/PqqE/SkfB family radical SAM enzyme
MYQIGQVKHVHLEISSRCNASCPQCPRNFYGYPYNDGYLEHDMTLAEAQTIFSAEFIQQLREIYINGNFGDAVMNPETVSIVEYFRQCSPALTITISTNGGARDQKFWQSLAKAQATVIFCIDGLEDTHSLYRQNTLYSTVMRNAQIFIEAGGRAVWKMIKFDHNAHQIDQARDLSAQLGFQEFRLIDDGRNQGPVYDQHGNLVHVLGEPAVTEFKILFDRRKTDEVLLEDIVGGRTPRPITCDVQRTKSVYISSTGDVYPCCFLGFNPKNYGHGNYHQAANAQFRHLIQKNNALENPLETCLQWFSSIENSWKIPTFEQGRLIICNDVCGQTQ